MEWISVRDRLPKLRETVFIYYIKSGKPFMTQGVLRDEAVECASERHPVSFWRNLGYDLTWYDDKRQIQSLTAKKSKNNVTHWMPLPDPPKQ